MCNSSYGVGFWLHYGWLEREREREKPTSSKPKIIKKGNNSSPAHMQRAEQLVQQQQLNTNPPLLKSKRIGCAADQHKPTI
jgi:hypothetical protein